MQLSNNIGPQGHTCLLLTPIIDLARIGVNWPFAQAHPHHLPPHDLRGAGDWHRSCISLQAKGVQMSVEAVREVVRRALSEDDFRGLLIEQPYDALEGYDLSPEEQGALIAGSEPGLTELGVDSETARAYTDLFRISRGGGG